ncbi:MAG: hypothetical protein KatS3mg111_3989 [Pirellulaceae bacterium]|nr:MAG: hypothetical protein KatS3mg111_3989 [Pirellulaceae bacterium]
MDGRVFGCPLHAQSLIGGQSYDPLARFESATFSVEVTDGGDVSPLVVELVRTAAVAGQIVDANGRPVVAAKVVARFTDERDTVERAAWSDVTGAFLLRGLPKHATVELTARKENLTTSTDQPIRVMAGQTEPIDLVLQEVPTARLTGRVTDEAGRPLPGGAG